MSGQTRTLGDIGFWAFVVVLFAVLGGGVWAHIRETKRQRAACEAQPGRVLVVTQSNRWCLLGERGDAGR